MKPLDLAAWCAALFLAANLFPHTVALRLILLALGLALVVFTLVRAKAMHRPLDVEILPPLLVPILLWAAWAALSVTWSVEPYRSLKEFKNEVVYVFLGYWLCWVAAQAPGARRAFGTVLGGGAVLTCVVGLYGFAVPASQPWLARLASGPGDQSSALLTLMPCALVAIWLAREEQAPRTLQRVLWALPPLFLAAAYATLNRTVWIGFAVEVAVMAALVVPRSEFGPVLNSGRARLFAGLLAAAFVGGVVLVGLQVQETRYGGNLRAAIAKDPRMEVWIAAVDTIKKHPIAGIGFGRGIDRQSLHEEFGNPLLWHAHNLILETAVGVGVLGAMLLLLLIGATAYKGGRLACNPQSTVARYGAALVAVVAGMFVRNATDTLLVRQNALLYWGVAALLLGLATVGRKRG